MAMPTTENNKHQGSSLEHIDSLIKAKIPYIWITTHEEERFIKALYETVTEKRHRELWIWSGYQGVVPASASALFTLEDSKQGISVPGIKRASGDWDKTWDPRIALEKIDQYRLTDKKKTGAVFIMRDFNLALQGIIPRQMRDMYNSLINSCKTIVIISPSLCHGEGGRRSGMESTLEKQVITVPYELPTRESIEGTVREWIDNLKDKKGIRTGYSEEEINKFSIALQGLTELEIVNAICVSVTHLKEINAPRLLKEKQQIIKRAEILEYINVMPALEDIGGLDAAKKYFATYNRQFSPEAIAYGVEPLKGILFVGVCGCIRGDTLITDPIDHTIKTVKDRYIEAKPFYVNSRDKQGETVIAQALPPIKYPKARMISFVTDKEEKITVTENHRFLSSSGWISAREVFANVQQFESTLLLSSQEYSQQVLQQDVQHSKKIILDSQVDYRTYFYSGDEQLLQVKDIVQDIVPLQVDALGHSRIGSHIYSQHMDDLLEHEQEYNPISLQSCHLSMQDSVVQNDYTQCQNVSKKGKLCPGLCSTLTQSHLEVNPERKGQQPIYHEQVSKQVYNERVFLKPLHDNSQNSPCEFVLRFPVAQVQLLLDDQNCQEFQLLEQESFPVDKDQRLSVSVPQSMCSSVTSWNHSTRYTRIIKAEYSTEEEYYDFHVPGYKNYKAAGLWHHNCGKSYLAKAIAGLWGLPLLRLDIGKVMGGVVGASEANMRQVVSQIESIAPAILWVDEIEKGLSGTKSSNFSDGGTLARVFGTLLTAMEEGMKNVVVIATANDIQALPPELIRRFSEILFVDLPVPSEREEIFKIHLRMRGRDTKKLKIKMDELVAASHNYTGSEIEKVVREAIARAFQAEKPDVTQEELLGAIKDTKPIATVMKEQISNIREWARDKARYASSLAAEAAMPGHQKISTSTGRELDLASALDDPEELNPEKKKTSVKTRIDEVLDGDSN